MAHLQVPRLEGEGGTQGPTCARSGLWLCYRKEPSRLGNPRVSVFNNRR